MGKTIVGARGKSRELELKRMEERKKKRRKNWLIGCGAAVVGILMVTWATVGVAKIVSEKKEVAENIEVKWAPTVEVISEGGGVASGRVNEFVAKVEKDFRDLGRYVERVVLPAGMMREVDVYVGDRAEYYKFSVDRGSAVQVEDSERMMKFLDERGLVVGYVDLRVEGKAYFK